MTLLRLAFLCIVIYIVYSALKPLLRGGKKPADPARLGEDMVLDPQCQTYVAEIGCRDAPRKVFLQRRMRAALFNRLGPAGFVVDTVKAAVRHHEHYVPGPALARHMLSDG